MEKEKNKSRASFRSQMNPHTYFLFPFTVGLILTKLNIINWKLALIGGFIGVFVDIDHYIEHILHARKNKFSLSATWNNSIKLHRFKQRSFIHHWDGALILTTIFVLLAYSNWKITLVIATGYYSHLVLDFLFHLKEEISFKWKIGRMYVKETHLEFILDLVLIIILAVLIFL